MATILRHDTNHQLSRTKQSVNSKPSLDKHVTTPPTRSAWNSRFFHAPKQSIANPWYVYSVSGYIEQIRYASPLRTNLINFDHSGFDLVLSLILSLPSESTTFRYCLEGALTYVPQ